MMIVSQEPTPAHGLSLLQELTEHHNNTLPLEWSPRNPTLHRIQHLKDGVWRVSSGDFEPAALPQATAK